MVWSKQFATGDHICGDVASWCRLIISLKFMLDQRLSTVPQHQWITKLFGFDFTVEYRPGRLNTVTDALSRGDSEQQIDYAVWAIFQSL